MTINTKNLEKYLRTGKRAGSPADQMRRFVDGGYVSLPKMLPFHAAARQADHADGPFWLGLGGSRGPGKSHAALAQVGLDDCQRFDGLKWLFLRKLQRSASESLEDLVYRVLHSVPYNSKQGEVEFPNGSRILIGGYKDERDIEKYIGIEYDGVVIEEMNTITEEKVIRLRGSVRTSRPDWRPRFYVSFNPGSIGHLMVKDHFVTPYRERRSHRFIGGLTAYFPSTYRDNPFLDADYVEYLEAIPGPLGKAWREGDFDVFEGMAFPQWNESLHVIEPFMIPENWPKWRAVDWGSSKPFCCQWFARQPGTGRIIVYRELYGVGLSDREQARAIVDNSPEHESIQITWADPSMFTKSSKDGIWTSSADEYQVQGVILTPADNNRIAGKRKFERALGLLPDGKPGIQYFRTCANSVRTIPALPADDLNPEDVDTDAEDHAYDTSRYGLSREKSATEEPKKARPNPMMAIPNM